MHAMKKLKVSKKVVYIIKKSYFMQDFEMILKYHIDLTDYLISEFLISFFLNILID